jgi:hypothetical protein
MAFWTAARAVWHIQRQQFEVYPAAVPRVAPLNARRAAVRRLRLRC